MKLVFLILAGVLAIAAANRLTAGVTAVWDEVTQARPEIICDIWHHCDLWPEAWKPKRISSEHRDPHLKAHACARDGLSPEECKKHEGDHRIPLCAGGPDTLDNMQLQPCDLWVVRNGIPECKAGEAWRKDLVEWHWCDAIRAAERKGDETKADALRKEAGDYFTNHKRCPPATEGCW